MRRNRSQHCEAVSFRNYRGCPVQIAMDYRVPEFILSELQRFPDSEDGGKYIGFVSKRNKGAARIVVTDFLPSGPDAKRTRVEFMPDGEFQERLFRQAERRHKDVEHIGSWHSHHCNGLDTLSQGDIKGYFKTVNNRKYRPHFFLASLVTGIPNSPQDSGWLHHYLFVRGDENFYTITNEVVLVNVSTDFGDITGHMVPGISGPSSPADNEQTLAPARDWADSSSGAGVQNNLSLLWYESQLGRQTLAQDRQFFMEAFEGRVIASRLNRRIKLKGTYPDGAAISIVYPASCADDSVQINLLHHDQVVLTILCNLSVRRVALAGALNMKESL